MSVPAAHVQDGPPIGPCSQQGAAITVGCTIAHDHELPLFAPVQRGEAGQAFLSCLLRPDRLHDGVTRGDFDGVDASAQCAAEVEHNDDDDNDEDARTDADPGDPVRRLRPAAGVSERSEWCNLNHACRADPCAHYTPAVACTAARVPTRTRTKWDSVAMRPPAADSAATASSYGSK